MSSVQSVSLNSQNYANNKCRTQSFSAKSANDQPKTDTQPSKDTFQMEKTHAGLITGGILSTVGTVSIGLLSGFKNPRLLLLFIPTATGLLADFMTNKKRKKFNVDVQEQGADKIYKKNKKTEKTRSDIVYLKDNSGKKIGAGVGALTGLVGTGLMASNIKKANGLSKWGVVSVLASGAVASSVFGFIQGMISDACANRAAKKHAEKVDLEA